MSIRRVWVPVLLVFALVSLACKYIVLPEGLEAPGEDGNATAGWSAVATNVGKSASGDLRVDLTIQNETGDWSAMNVSEGKPVVLTSAGKNTNCDTVFLGSGGHRLAPGFQMRGYTAGTKAEPVIQPLYVECKGADAAPGATLSIPYTYVTGQYNYYEQDKNRVDAILKVNLDEVATDLTYPVAKPIDGLVQKPDLEILALNKVSLALTGADRSEAGLRFAWRTTNPGEYPTYVHIGTPPVIGSDGILYGFYETPDIVSVPITPAGNQAEWETEVAVPEDVKGLYTLLSVETGKARLFANYVLDTTDK